MNARQAREARSAIKGAHILMQFGDELASLYHAGIVPAQAVHGVFVSAGRMSKAGKSSLYRKVFDHVFEKTNAARRKNLERALAGVVPE